MRFGSQTVWRLTRSGLGPTYHHPTRPARLWYYVLEELLAIHCK